MDRETRGESPLLSIVAGIAMGAVVLVMIIMISGQVKNLKPIAIIAISHKTVPVNGIFELSGKLSFDPDKTGNITSYKWDFGDKNTAVGESVSHSYENGGDYKVTLTVTDNRGATASTSVVIFALYDYY